VSTRNALLAIRVEDRNNNAVKVQEILTKHGCSINVRLGLHDQDANVCSPCGTMILQLSCKPVDAKVVVEDLRRLDGVKAQFIDLD
jgi:lipoate-protein ligase B